MFDRNVRRGVNERTCDGEPHVSSSLKAYTASLYELEKTLSGLIDSFSHYLRALHQRIQDQGDHAEIVKIRYSSMLCLKSILCLQTQLLKKYEVLQDAGFPIHHPPAAPVFAFPEALVLETFRMILSHPEEWRRIRRILREINRYKDKKQEIADRCPFVPASTRPWLNPALVRDGHR